MSRLPTLELMTTDHCSLCDAALDWLLASPLARGLPLSTVDITAEAALFDDYAERVPVLVLKCEGQVLDELAWPFTDRSFEQLLRHPTLTGGGSSDH